MIRDYPAKCAEQEEMRGISAVKLDGLPGGGGAGRPVENAALRGFTGQKGREFEAVRRAIERTRLRPDGEDILVLIDLMYWKQTHTIDGAAHLARTSRRTALRRNQAFIRCVARGMGLMDE